MRNWQFIKKIFLAKQQKRWLVIVRQIFVSSAILVTFSTITEYLIPGFVANWFNPIWFLLVLVISGMIVAFYD